MYESITLVSISNRDIDRQRTLLPASSNDSEILSSASMVRLPIKRVAVIGAGPAGAITIDALVQEKTFDLIRVFERRHEAGGCWSGDDRSPPAVSNIASLGDRTADPALTLPKTLPALLPKSDQTKFDEATVYPYLETNVIADAMRYSQEPIPTEVSHLSRNLYGDQSPYRHWKVMRQYIHGLIKRDGYEDLVSYNTSVEKAEKVGSLWHVTLRKPGKEFDYWWQEEFDAVVVANGHYNVPYIPPIPGLDELEKLRPGSVVHSKHFRGRDRYIGKVSQMSRSIEVNRFTNTSQRIVIVGVSVSAADIAFDLTSVAATPVHAITIGHRPNLYFGDEAFNHPLIQRHPSINKTQGRTVHLQDGTQIDNVDHIIFGTGYTWTIPFLSHSVKTRHNRVPDLYQHVVWQHDPSLLFVGAVHAGLTFKVFEWQAVYAASLLSGRGTLPSLDEMRKWEEERIAKRGDGPRFVLVYPDFEDYFETLRRLSGDGKDGKGRRLPKFRREWFRDFMDGHELRKRMWRRLNEEARCKLKGDEKKERARLYSHDEDETLTSLLRNSRGPSWQVVLAALPHRGRSSLASRDSYLDIRAGHSQIDDDSERFGTVEVGGRPDLDDFVMFHTLVCPCVIASARRLDEDVCDYAACRTLMAMSWMQSKVCKHTASTRDFKLHNTSMESNLYQFSQDLKDLVWLAGQWPAAPWLRFNVDIWRGWEKTSAQASKLSRLFTSTWQRSPQRRYELRRSWSYGYLHRQAALPATKLRNADPQSAAITSSTQSKASRDKTIVTTTTTPTKNIMYTITSLILAFAGTALAQNPRFGSPNNGEWSSWITTATSTWTVNSTWSTDSTWTRARPTTWSSSATTSTPVSSTWSSSTTDSPSSTYDLTWSSATSSSCTRYANTTTASNSTLSTTYSTGTAVSSGVLPGTTAGSNVTLSTTLTPTMTPTASPSSTNDAGSVAGSMALVGAIFAVAFAFLA
ncbi:hypothetical protein AC579_5395 [Pseudocercospora musae]|uniref:FAD/NAD(P)-binding domain-containing protein n=1 Tax=Pseudocercospora musae TaxID=113226 RepID=A0A139IDR4_9PEZI|nr:hypothetical protein AC579_5395 [Pseudocercospora musae]